MSDIVEPGWVSIAKLDELDKLVHPYHRDMFWPTQWHKNAYAEWFTTEEEAQMTAFERSIHRLKQGHPITINVELAGEKIAQAMSESSQWTLKLKGATKDVAPTTVPTPIKVVAIDESRDLYGEWTTDKETGIMMLQTHQGPRWLPHTEPSSAMVAETGPELISPPTGSSVYQLKEPQPSRDLTVELEIHVNPAYPHSFWTPLMPGQEGMLRLGNESFAMYCKHVDVRSGHGEITYSMRLYRENIGDIPLVADPHPSLWVNGKFYDCMLCSLAVHINHNSSASIGWFNTIPKQIAPGGPPKPLGPTVRDPILKDKDEEDVDEEQTAPLLLTALDILSAEMMAARWGEWKVRRTNMDTYHIFKGGDPFEVAGNLEELREIARQEDFDLDASRWTPTDFYE